MARREKILNGYETLDSEQWRTNPSSKNARENEFPFSRFSWSFHVQERFFHGLFTLFHAGKVFVFSWFSCVVFVIFVIFMLFRLFGLFVIFVIFMLFVIFMRPISFGLHHFHETTAESITETKNTPFAHTTPPCGIGLFRTLLWPFWQLQSSEISSDSVTESHIHGSQPQIMEHPVLG